MAVEGRDGNVIRNKMEREGWEIVVSGGRG